jgi:hypothetical protein
MGVPNCVICLRRWTGGAWEEFGGSLVVGSADNLRRGSPGMALDGAGFPVVAWTEENDIHLRRWDGKEWAELGGSASAGGLSRSGRNCAYPVVAVGREGRIHVAWIAAGGPGCVIELREWDGKSWKDLGLGATCLGEVREDARCGLALDGAGRPVVAWLGHEGEVGHVYLKRWDGAAWVEVGGSASEAGLSRSTGKCGSVALALDARDRPVVAWCGEQDRHSEIYLRRWDGAAWVELAGSGSGSGISRNFSNSMAPALGLDGTGNPVVAWVDGEAGNNDIFLRRFEETAPSVLRQLKSNGVTPLPRGAAAKDVAVSATLGSPVPGVTLTLEVEVRPVGTAFTGEATTRAAPVPAGVATARLEGLPPGPKHWQARAMDSMGMVSPWVPFGGNPETEPDFAISEGSSPVASGCGLSGMEAMVVVLAFWRTRKKERGMSR